MIDLLVILVVLGLVVLFVSAPLRRASSPSLAISAEPPAVGELEAARDAKLRELRDAELDHRTGKLSDQDFQAVDATLRREAIEILRELDETRVAISPGADPDVATITGE